MASTAAGVPEDLVLGIPRHLWTLGREVSRRVLLIAGVAALAISSVRATVEIEFTLLQGSGPAILASNLILYWWIRPYVSAICVDVKVVIFNTLLDCLILASLAPACLVLIWIYARWPPDGHATAMSNLVISLVALFPLYIPGTALVLYSPADTLMQNVRKITKNWIILVLLIALSSGLIAYALEIANARNRSAQSNPSTFTTEWILSLDISWPPWEVNQADLESEDVSAKILLKRTQYVLVYETFFGLAGQIIVLRTETIASFSLSLAFDMVVPALLRIYFDYRFFRQSRRLRDAVVAPSTDANKDSRREPKRDSGAVVDEPPTINFFATGRSDVQITVSNPDEKAPEAEDSAYFAKEKSDNTIVNAKSLPPISVSHRRHLTAESVPPCDHANSFHSTVSVIEFVHDAVTIQPLLARHVDPEIAHAWNIVMTIMSDWSARLSAFVLLLLLVASAQWARCNGSLTYSDLLARVAVSMTVEILIDMGILWLEMRVLRFDFAPVAALMVKTRFGVKSYLVAGLSMGCVASGLFYKQTSDCFR
ncbi:hypothetical protein DFJ73DRAFT_846310 [Zopfochytrium polystomum]|nr:hypothetical protein DFJ73DRAFT_846310 [Zopfochytrium polystomum]